MKKCLTGALWSPPDDTQTVSVGHTGICPSNAWRETWIWKLDWRAEDAVVDATDILGVG